jgi:enediyne biosynthesis protein E5
MTREAVLTTLSFYPNRNPKLRSFALWYFTILITIWTIVGHTVLGFEQSYAHPVAGVATACAMQFLLEWVDARANRRRPRFSGGLVACLNHLPPAIIPGLACAMLIYPNSRLWPVVFAAALSIASKVMFRGPVGNGRTQHIFNPSNLGITATLLLFPWVGLAPPYQFTENVTGVWDWIIPGIILAAGIYIHAKFTGRLPLVLAWLGGFATQALLRAAIFHMPWFVPFVPVTSAAFTLFTLFMIPDPATTPIQPRRQVAFGMMVAAIYGLLFVLHVVFGLFIALCLTSAARGVGLYVIAAWKRYERREEMAEIAGSVAAAAP